MVRVVVMVVRQRRRRVAVRYRQVSRQCVRSHLRLWWWGVVVCGCARAVRWARCRLLAARPLLCLVHWRLLTARLVVVLLPLALALQQMVVPLLRLPLVVRLVVV